VCLYILKLIAILSLNHYELTNREPYIYIYIYIYVCVCARAVRKTVINSYTFFLKSCLELVKCEHRQAHRSENSLAYFFHRVFYKLNKTVFL
jgi:hypothetical protein